jgi:hypothetical protein
MTVGELRKLIEGLPDHGWITLSYSTDSENTIADLGKIRADGDGLVVQVDIYEPCEYCDKRECECDEHWEEEDDD